MKHSAGEFVRYLESETGHTNGVESFWAVLKRAHKGVCHRLSTDGDGGVPADVPGSGGGRDDLDRLAALFSDPKRPLSLEGQACMEVRRLPRAQREDETPETLRALVKAGQPLPLSDPLWARVPAR